MVEHWRTWWNILEDWMSKHGRTWKIMEGSSERGLVRQKVLEGWSH